MKTTQAERAIRLAEVEVAHAEYLDRVENLVAAVPDLTVYDVEDYLTRGRTEALRRRVLGDSP